MIHICMLYIIILCYNTSSSAAVIQRTITVISYRYQVGIFTGVSAKQGSWTQKMDFSFQLNSPDC